jgi:hypothetical protein
MNVSDFKKGLALCGYPQFYAPVTPVVNNITNVTNDITQVVDTLADSLGFIWRVDSGNNPGSASMNGFPSWGTPAWVDAAATGTDFTSTYAHQEWDTGATAWSGAGLSSSKGVVKLGAGNMGGFTYEAVFAVPYVLESEAFFGLYAGSDKAFNNFQASSVGIGVGWNDTDTGASALQLFAGDGTAFTQTAGAAGKLSDGGVIHVKIDVPVGGAGATVSAKNLDTGDVIFDNVAIPATHLPPAETAMNAYAAIGNRAGANSVVMHLWALRAVPKLVL